MKRQQGQGDIGEEEEDPEGQHCNPEDLLLGSDKWPWLIKGGPEHGHPAGTTGPGRNHWRKVPCWKGILSDNQHLEFHQLTVV